MYEARLILGHYGPILLSMLSYNFDFSLSLLGHAWLNNLFNDSPLRIKQNHPNEKKLIKA